MEALMIKNRENAEYYRWGEVCDGWRLLDGQDLSVIQERIPPRHGEVRHRHHRARQLFYVLKGGLRIERGEAVFELAAGDSLEVPPGEPHRVRNAGEADASFLVISAPTTRGDRENLDRE
jgi:mannose-6-phosphate isomerase-like protein (cupin superfamily)